VPAGAAVQLDGTQSVDPDGNALTYQWTQTLGPAVTLSSTTASRPTFTAPATSVAFQLVVSDGQSSSTPATANITVANLALLATATASSQATASGQTANKAIDDVIDGYPGDYTREWATESQGTGSWLKLTWPSPQVISSVVLYDRPNANDRVTAGTIQFSDGSAIAVGALNDNGTGVTVRFPAKTVTSLTFNVTAISATTSSAGLAELQAFGSSATQQPPIMGACSSAVTVQLQDSNGTPVSGTATQVALSSASGKLVFYAEPGCSGSPVTSIYISSSGSSGTFSFVDTAASPAVMAATAAD
jgi:hypothetical protein